MPTIRSQFSFEQFETVLQKLAHETALEAVKTLNHGRVRIVIDGPKLKEVVTDKSEFKFYANHASLTKKASGWKDWWAFDVEEKLYLTSNHCTKISFYAGEDREEREKKILAFIDKMMAEASMNPIPRFTLSQSTGNQRYLDLMNKK